MPVVEELQLGEAYQSIQSLRQGRIYQSKSAGN